MSRKLVQIVTGLPPDIDGVGDYAITLARALREQSDIDSIFLIGNPAWSGRETVDGFRTMPLRQRDSGVLQNALAECGVPPDSPVLLHCSMYGYATRALPFWLVNGLHGWKRLRPGSLLITMFHELVSTGPIWTTAFWSNPIQCHLIKRLAKQSDAYIVSNANYSRQLARMADLDECTIQQLPVLSTVGEPPSILLPKAANRKRQMVVFGRGSTRDAVFTNHRLALETACRNLNIDRIIEIGPGGKARRVAGVSTIEALGVLDPREITMVLRESLFGFISLDADLLGKSSVWAAFCAHGMVSIVAGKYGAEAGGLQAGTHYLPADPLAALDSAQIESIGQAAHRWYQEHSSEMQARHYASIAFGVRGASLERFRTQAVQA